MFPYSDQNFGMFSYVQIADFGATTNKTPTNYPMTTIHQSYKQRDRQTDRQTDRWTDRQLIVQYYAMHYIDASHGKNS